jgi:hypothetical protein
MVDIIAAENVTLEQLRTLFGLELVQTAGFFPEWQTDLPEISSEEKALLNQIKDGYVNLRNYPPLLESTITIISPLLFIGKFYLPPFHLKLEKSVEIETEDNQIIVRGRIDILLLNENVWLMVIESKRLTYSVEVGLDQILSYMLASPPEKVYGMITTGESFIFLKLVKGNPPRYATSDIFHLRNRGNQLEQVLQILKKLTL